MATKSLNIEQRRAIFELILNNYTNGFKAYLMLVETVPEPIVEAGEIFNARVEGFLPRSCTALS